MRVVFLLYYIRFVIPLIEEKSTKKGRQYCYYGTGYRRCDQVQFSTKLEILPQQWDVQLGRAKGSTVKAAQLNLLLDNIRSGFIDIPIKEIKITTVFIEDFYLYIRNNTNSSMKFVQRFRIVLNYAKNSGLNFIVPFSNYKFNFYKVDRDYLDQKEIDMIYTKNLLYSTGE